MITVLGKSDKPCVFCGNKEHTVRAKFKDGTFAGIICAKCLFARIPAEPTKDKKEAAA